MQANDYVIEQINFSAFQQCKCHGKMKLLRRSYGCSVHLASGNILYCFDRVVIAAQCTATFLRSTVLPQI